MESMGCVIVQGLGNSLSRGEGSTVVVEAHEGSQAHGAVNPTFTVHHALEYVAFCWITSLGMNHKRQGVS